MAAVQQATHRAAINHSGFRRAKNIQTVLIARFLAGAFGSTGSTMVRCFSQLLLIINELQADFGRAGQVGGTIADIWQPYEYAILLRLAVLYSLLTGMRFSGEVFPWQYSPSLRLEVRA